LQAIRSFTNAPIKVLVNTHIHSDHTGANAFFAKQGAVIFSQENLRSEMARPPLRAGGQPAPAPDMAGVPTATYTYNAAAPGQPAVTFNMNGETVDFIPMMPSHTAGDTIVRFRNANATQGDTQQSKDRFITEVYDEVKDFPPIVDGKRTMSAHP